jgi:hypothetical protein
MPTGEERLMPAIPEVRRDIPLDQLATARRGVVDIPAHQILDRGEPDDMAGPYLARRESAAAGDIIGRWQRRLGQERGAPGWQLGRR